jgi:hypothetical protein
MGASARVRVRGCVCVRACCVLFDLAVFLQSKPEDEDEAGQAAKVAADLKPPSSISAASIRVSLLLRFSPLLSSFRSSASCLLFLFLVLAHLPCACSLLFLVFAPLPRVAASSSPFLLYLAYSLLFLPSIERSHPPQPLFVVLGYSSFLERFHRLACSSALLLEQVGLANPVPRYSLD